LQCVPVCSSVFQCVPVCCSVLQCVAVCYSVLQCAAFVSEVSRISCANSRFIPAVCCSVLPCDAVCGICDWCAATHCNTLQHTATLCTTLQHTATHCNICDWCITHFLRELTLNLAVRFMILRRSGAYLKKNLKNWLNKLLYHSYSADFWDFLCLQCVEVSR